MEKLTIITMAIAVISLATIGNAYADESVLLSDHATILISDKGFEEGFVDQYVISKEGVIRERVYGEQTRVFANTTTGENIYILYDSTTIKIKIWTDDRSIRIIEPIISISEF